MSAIKTLHKRRMLPFSFRLLPLRHGPAQIQAGTSLIRKRSRTGSRIPGHDAQSLIGCDKGRYHSEYLPPESMLIATGDSHPCVAIQISDCQTIIQPLPQGIEDLRQPYPDPSSGPRPLSIAGYRIDRGASVDHYQLGRQRIPAPVQYIPAIIQFLGYDPLEAFAARLIPRPHT